MDPICLIFLCYLVQFSYFSTINLYITVNRRIKPSFKTTSNNSCVNKTYSRCGPCLFSVRSGCSAGSAGPGGGAGGARSPRVRWASAARGRCGRRGRAGSASAAGQHARAAAMKPVGAVRGAGRAARGGEPGAHGRDGELWPGAAGAVGAPGTEEQCGCFGWAPAAQRRLVSHPKTNADLLVSSR